MNMHIISMFYKTVTVREYTICLDLRQCDIFLFYDDDISLYFSQKAAKCIHNMLRSALKLLR